MAGYIGGKFAVAVSGDLSAAKGGGGDNIFFENNKTITADYEITTNSNAMTAGPVTLDDGVEVTIPSGSRWVIL